MLATPSRPRNAITVHSITPLRPKTASVPIDGRVLKAATLDADLTTELENTSIHEAAGHKESYVIFWCQLSELSQLSQIKARDLKVEPRVPLFIDKRWDPSLIPTALRQPELKLAEAADSTRNHSRLRTQTRRHQSNPPIHRNTRAAQKQPATTSTSTSKHRSLRRQSVTQTIPNTSVLETIEAMVLPLPGYEEHTVATWLNHIIASFSDPPNLTTSKSNQTHPEGWKGLHLTTSSGKKAKTAHPLRIWSSQYASKPVEHSQLTIKPDVVFCGQLDPHTGFVWHNVIAFLELTSSAYSAQLRRNIIHKAYAVFMSQPCRRFVVALSIAHLEFRLHVFDRSGAIHSLGYNIHKFADLFVRVIYVFAFGDPASLGFDPTFLDTSLSPSILFRPRSTRAIRNSRLIYIRDVPYSVIRPIFVSHLICGRATSSWQVKRGKKVYVIKDYWTHKGRKVTEEEILKKIAGLVGVPELVEAWTVQIGGADETTDLLRPAFLGVSFESRVHRRLLMTPVGEPLVNFQSLRELVSIFIDIVHVHFILVDVYCILHRDISFNNLLMFVCSTRWSTSSEAQEKREDLISNKFRRGLLIDFDYASFLNTEKQGVSSGDRTGTIPFMALDLLREYTDPSSTFVHTFSHDLESLIYVLVWVCVLYQAPNEIRRDKTVEQTCLKQWALAKTPNDVQALHDQKLGQLYSRTVLDHFTPYFAPMKPFVSELYKLIQHSRDPAQNVILTHAAVTDVLMDAFNSVEEVTCGATNAKRAWQSLRREPAPTQSEYYSEGRNIRRRVA